MARLRNTSVEYGDIHASNGDKIGAGGVATLIPISFVQDGTCNATEYVPGRALRTQVTVENRTAIYWNIHHYDIAPNALRNIFNAINDDIDKAERDPLFFSVSLLGDFNLNRTSECRKSLAKPTNTSKRSKMKSTTRPNQLA